MYRCIICDCNSNESLREWFIVKGEVRCSDCQDIIKDTVLEYYINDLENIHNEEQQNKSEKNE